MKQTYPDYLSAYSRSPAIPGPNPRREFSAPYEKLKFTVKIQRRKWEVMAIDLKWGGKWTHEWNKAKKKKGSASVRAKNQSETPVKAIRR